MPTPPKSEGSIDYLSYAALMLLAVCFGATFFFTDLALDGLSVMANGSARIVIAACFLVPLSLFTGHGLPKTANLWVWSAGLGAVAWVIPFILIVWAQTRIPSNVIGAFLTAVPLIILFLSWAILKTEITFRKTLGLIIGSIGLVVLAGPGTLSQLGNQTEYLAQIAVFICILGFASGAIIIRLMPSPSTIQATASASLASAILVMPVLIWELPGSTLDWKTIVGVLGTGVFSTGVGQFLRFFLIRRRGPVFIVPNGYLSAIVAAVFGMTLLGERLTSLTVIAFVIILVGLAIASDGSGRMKQV